MEEVSLKFSISGTSFSYCERSISLCHVPPVHSSTRAVTTELNETELQVYSTSTAAAGREAEICRDGAHQQGFNASYRHVHCAVGM